MRASNVTSAALIKQARDRAGLTQRELAANAGVAQSVVAAYESATREPSFSTLAALVEATGVTLEVDLGLPLPTQHAPVGPIGHRVRRHRAAILAIAAKYGVTDIRIFGSVARGDERPNSDLDLLVHLPDGTGLFALGQLKLDLENLLNLPVDVTPDEGVKPRVRVNIDRDVLPL